MATMKLTGNLLLQLLEGILPSTVPVGFETTYSESAMHNFVYTTTQTNIAVPQASVSAPRIVLVFLTEGSISLSWDVAGLAPTVLTANPLPGNNDKPVMVLFRYTAPASQLYLSCAAAKGSIWVFE